MKVLTKRFDRIVNDNPNLSSFVCFCMALKGQNYHTDFVLNAFETLVDKSDYRRAEKDEIIDWVSKKIHNL